MKKVTVSAKVSEETAHRISDTGYRTSDVVRAGLGIFLDLPVDEQSEAVREQLVEQKREHAMRIHLDRESSK